jgi:ribosomal protein S18 acetylase RimI-like enzyme
MTLLTVTYLELREPPASPTQRVGPERIALERPSLQDYLALYRKVGAPLRWDQRLQMPENELTALLNSSALSIYVLKGEYALGFCEFDRQSFPDIEIKNFGLIPEGQGRGLGTWLLSVALHREWQSNPRRIWLHTDSWDHPSALKVYERVGFKIYDVREEESGPL